MKTKSAKMGDKAKHQSANGWISVTEGLPPKEKNDHSTSIFVDVFDGKERWPDCYYCFLEKEWIWNDTGEPLSINATHWKKITLPTETEELNNEKNKIDEALEWLEMIPLHVKTESHHGGHIMHFLENGIRCLKK